VKPLRILTVTNVTSDPNSGAAGTVLHTNVALRELGHEVDAIFEGDLPPRRIAHGNLHALFEQPRSYRSAVFERLRTQHYDVIQMSQPQAALAARALRARGFPGLIVNRSHGVELRAERILPDWHRRLGVPESRFPWASALFRRLLARQWRGLARDCHGIIVGCEMDREFLCRELRLPPSRVLAAAHGVAAEFLATPPCPPSPERNRRLLHVGQFAFFKGSYLLIDIVNGVLSADPQAEFTWVSSASSHAFIREKLAPAVLPRVKLLAPVPLAEVSRLYDTHGIFVFPSLFEGYGKAAAEAMARGMCVIASDEGGMHDYLANGLNGWLCPPGDVNAFIACALRMLRDPGGAGMLGAGAATSTRRLTWKLCAEQAEAFYHQLMSPGSAE
jgi:glycosyltransferase involved in cell wall biosynthesis